MLLKLTPYQVHGAQISTIPSEIYIVIMSRCTTMPNKQNQKMKDNFE